MAQCSPLPMIIRAHVARLDTRIETIERRGYPRKSEMKILRRLCFERTAAKTFLEYLEQEATNGK